jgi:drug/metabolite transporter (DMT)-like permease
VPRGERRPLALAAFLNITLWHVGSAAGVYFMEAGRASIIAFTMPVWAALFGTLFLGERLTAARLAGLALGLAGLGVLVLPDLGKMTAAPIGVTFMLLAAMSWALGTVVVKARSWSLSTAQLTGWQLVIGSIPIAAAAPLTDPPPSVSNLNTETLLVLAYILVFPMIVAQWSWFRLLKLQPAGIAAIGTLAVPVAGGLSSAFFLGEPIGRSEIIALFLVLAALAVVLFRPPLRAERS